MKSLLDYELLEGEDFSWQASQDWLHDWRSEVVRSSSMLHRVNVSYNRRDPLDHMHITGVFPMQQVTPNHAPGVHNSLVSTSHM